MENMKKNIDDIYDTNDDYLDEEYFYSKWKAEYNNIIDKK